MSFSGGVYTLPGPALVTGEVVSATENNQFRNDVAGAFNVTMLRNGTSTATANLPMGGYKLTGLGVATTSGDALSYGQAATVSNFTASGTVTISSGTANGVAYLNGSKVLTTGSALTFDGTNFATTGSVTSAGASNSGNLTFTGTGNRIIGDFSNATLANRVLFQNSASNTDTYLGIVPNGTSVASGLLSFNSSSPDNSGYGGFAIGSGSVTFLSGKIGTGTYLPMTFSTGGLERMRIDTSGNLGLGVTPSAWGSGFKALQVNSGASLVGDTANAYFNSNAYYNGTNWIYSISNYASRYAIGQGQHYWYTAPSGTAGNAITFTQAMTLDASGNLGIGVTNNAAYPYGGKLNVNGEVSLGSNGGRLGWGITDAFTWNGVSAAQYGLTYEPANFVGLSGFYSVAFATGGTERMRIDSSGNLLVGTTSAFDASAKAQVYNGTAGQTVFATKTNGTAGAAAIGFYNPNGVVGSIVTNGSSTAYNTSSDYRLKENIQPMQGALAVVQQLNPVTYTWKADGSDGQGFIAHELQAVVPDCVTGEKDATRIENVEVSPAVPATFDEEGNELTPAVEAVYEEREVPVYQGIDTSFLVATLTKAIQELAAKVDAQQAEIDALKNTAA